MLSANKKQNDYDSKPRGRWLTNLRTWAVRAACGNHHELAHHAHGFGVLQSGP
jgi:hypothetical protein